MELAEYEKSDAFTAEERDILAYADCLTATPAEVPDALFNRLRAILPERAMIEITAAENNKAAAVGRVLEQNCDYAIIIAAGDDLTDESIFELSVPRMLTIKVGPGPTQARFRVKDPIVFRELLGDLFTR